MTADQLLDSLSQWEVRVARVPRLVQDAVGGGRDAVEHELASAAASSKASPPAAPPSARRAGRAAPRAAALERELSARLTLPTCTTSASSCPSKSTPRVLDDDDDEKAIDEVLPKIEENARESLKHESEKAVRNQQRAQAKARRKL